MEYGSKATVRDRIKSDPIKPICFNKSSIRTREPCRLPIRYFPAMQKYQLKLTISRERKKRSIAPTGFNNPGVPLDQQSHYFGNPSTQIISTTSSVSPSYAVILISTTSSVSPNYAVIFIKYHLKAPICLRPSRPPTKPPSFNNPAAPLDQPHYFTSPKTQTISTANPIPPSQTLSIGVPDCQPSGQPTRDHYLTESGQSVCAHTGIIGSRVQKRTTIRIVTLVSRWNMRGNRAMAPGRDRRRRYSGIEGRPIVIHRGRARRKINLLRRVRSSLGLSRSGGSRRSRSTGYATRNCTPGPCRLARSPAR